MIKQIIGENCGLNVYDFSCSNPCGNSTETTTSTTCITPTDLNDMEWSHSKPFFTKEAGGGKKKKKKKKKAF